MKEQAIAKINKMGKIGNIFVLIGKIFVIVGIVLLFITTIICAVIPHDLISFTAKGGLDLELNVGSIGESFSKEEQEEMKKEFMNIEEDNISAKLNDTEYIAQDIKVSDEKAVFSFLANSSSINFKDLAVVLLISLILLIMSLVTLFFLGSLCKAFEKCQSPFEENIINKMRNFAFSLIPWVILTSLTSSAIDSLLYGGLSLNLSLDMGMVLLVIIIFVLCYIFKYGAMLQQESDETL